MFSNISFNPPLLQTPLLSNEAQLAFKQQHGLFITSSIIVLLGISVFALASVTIAVNDFRTIREAMRVNQDHYLDVKKEMRNIRSQLRTKLPINITTNNASVVHSVASTAYQGAGFQALKTFDITLQHIADDIEVRQRFIRYPSIIRLPTPLQGTTPDTNLTQWLFNRSAAELLPRYFPLSVTAGSCNDLIEATVHWINGDCELDSDDVDHSNSANPMLLIIKNGHITVSNGTSFFGVIILLSDDGLAYSAKVMHGATIKGALTSVHTFSLQNNGVVDYSTEVLRALQQAPELAKVIAIPGSWHPQL
jgi:hypothetical protein